MLIEKFKNKPDRLFASMFWNMTFAFLPFNIAVGVFALILRIPISVNGEPTYGLGSFLTILVIAPLCSLGLAGIVWIYYSIGNYFLRLFIRLFK